MRRALTALILCPPLSKEEIAGQHAPYEALIEALGSVSENDFDAILAEGEPVEADARLDADLAARIEAKIAAARR